MEATTLPQSPTTETTPEPMPVWRRRIVLGMLLTLLAFLVTLEPRYGNFAAPEWFDWGSLWMGYFMFALPSLLAVWAAFRRQPLAVRLPRALALAACLGLALAWSVFDPTAGRMAIYALMLFFPAEVLLLTTLLTIVRRRAGWQIGLEHEWGTPESGGKQFSLQQLLIWTAACAVILSLAGWLTLPSSNQDIGWLETLVPLAAMGGIGSLWLLQAVPSVSFVLCPGSRRKFAAWMLGMALLTSLLVFGLGFIAMYLGNGANSSETLSVLTMSAEMVVGGQLAFLLTVLGVLWALRLCGYRLVRKKAPYVTAPLTVGPRPVWRTPFPYLVGTLGLLALALIWPAVRIEEGRKQTAADSALQQKCSELGVSASISSGRLDDIQFPPNQPTPDAALQFLQQFRDRSEPLFLDLSNRQVSDAQLAYLSDLRLTGLNLSGNPISDRGLAQLKHLEQVQSLYLANTQITDDGLKVFLRCEKLTGLCLDGTQVTDAGLAQLQGLKCLQAISVTNTQVTPEGEADLTGALPNCRVAPLSGAAVPATAAPSGP